MMNHYYTRNGIEVTVSEFGILLRTYISDGIQSEIFFNSMDELEMGLKCSYKDLDELCPEDVWGYWLQRKMDMQVR